MKLRNNADIRTLIWVAIAAALVVTQFIHPEWVYFLFPFSCYFALACGVIAHNHNHCPTFEGKLANAIFGNTISLFYGYPVLAWIPTHNLNHHRYVNTPGDATISWRFSNKHNLLVASTYFFVSSYYQSGPIQQFIARSKQLKNGMYGRIMRQYALWIGTHIAAVSLAINLYGVAGGLKLWGLSMALPSFFALYVIMLFNYDQHVHADPWSDHDHSRSFTSKAVNFFLFNNGYHAAHHEAPAAHWSTLAALHEKIAPEINPVLNEYSLFAYWFRVYFLAPFFPKLGTTQLGRGPMNPPEGKRSGIETAEVDSAGEGTNAAREDAPITGAVPAE